MSQDSIKKHSKKIDFMFWAVLILVVCQTFWAFLVYVGARESCTGTGTGANSSLRICQDNAFWQGVVPTILILLIGLVFYCSQNYLSNKTF